MITFADGPIFDLTIDTTDAQLRCQILGSEPVLLRGDFDNFSEDYQAILSALELAKNSDLRPYLNDVLVAKEGIQKIDGTTPERALLAPFSALHDFLSADGHVETLQARLAHLLAAWQWYNLCKRLLYRLPITENKAKGILSEQLRTAYRSLHRILRDPGYTGVLRLLVKGSMGVSHYDAISNAHMREMLIISTVLWPDEPVAASLSIGTAFAAFDDKNVFIPDWGKIRLYDVYQKDEGAQAEVRRLIAEILLPRYNLWDALHLARLLKNNQPGPILPGLLNRTLPFLVIAIILMIGMGIPENPFSPLVDWFPWASLATLIFGIALPIFLLFRYFDGLALPNFALPRVIGGVSIGYLTIALEGESAIGLANALWSQGFWLIIALWAGVLAAGLAYLFFDARPFTGDGITAFRRALGALLAAVVITLTTGFMACALTTAAYVDAWKDVGWMMTFVLGPFGWVSMGQMLVFAPVALFTGLATQFIFEDLTLPASVWSSEE